MVWQAVAQGALALGHTTINTAQSLGFFTPIQRFGGYWSNRLQPNVIPSVPETIDAYNRGMVNAPIAQRLLAMNGVNWEAGYTGRGGESGSGYDALKDIWDRIVDMGLSLPAPGELITMLNREIIDDRTFDNYLRRLGFRQGRTRQQIKGLKDELPGPSDLVSFALREAWDRQVVQTYGYDQEFPPEFDFWMKRQGYGGDPNPRIPGYQREPDLTWAKLYWRVHWQPISPTQSYEMFQRLRPSRIHRFQQVIPNVAAFGLADLRQVLKINDYPEPFRDRLAAIAYRVPRISDSARMLELGVITSDEFYEQCLDQGYDPTSARQRTDMVVKVNVNKRNAKLLSGTKTAILDSFRLGTLTPQDAAVALYQLAIAGTAAEPVFDQMTPLQKQAAALADSSVRASINSVVFKNKNDFARKILASVKRKFLMGFMDVTQASNALVNAGFLPDRTNTYIQEWLADLSGGRILISAGKIGRLYRRNIIGYPLAFHALNQLGYTNAQATLLLQDSQFDIQLDQARAAAGAAKDAKDRQRALQAAVHAAEQQHKQALAQLTRQASKTDLVRYFARGLIGEPVLRRELIRREYVQPYLQTIINDAWVQRQEYLDKKRKAAQQQAPKTGGATSGQNPGPNAGTPK